MTIQSKLDLSSQTKCSFSESVLNVIWHPDDIDDLWAIQRVMSGHGHPEDVLNPAVQRHQESLEEALRINQQENPECHLPDHICQT